MYVASGDAWEQLRKELLSLPDRVANTPADALPPDLANVLDAGAVTALRQFAADAAAYEGQVNGFVDELKQQRVKHGTSSLPVFVLIPPDRAGGPHRPPARPPHRREPSTIDLDPALTYGRKKIRCATCSPTSRASRCSACRSSPRSSSTRSPGCSPPTSSTST